MTTLGVATADALSLLMSPQLDTPRATPAAVASASIGTTAESCRTVSLLVFRPSVSANDAVSLSLRLSSSAEADDAGDRTAVAPAAVAIGAMAVGVVAIGVVAFGAADASRAPVADSSRSLEIARERPGSIKGWLDTLVRRARRAMDTMYCTFGDTRWSRCSSARRQLAVEARTTSSAWVDARAKLQSARATPPPTHALARTVRLPVKSHLHDGSTTTPRCGLTHWSSTGSIPPPINAAAPSAVRARFATHATAAYRSPATAATVRQRSTSFAPSAWRAPPSSVPAACSVDCPSTASDPGGGAAALSSDDGSGTCCCCACGGGGGSSLWARPAVPISWQLLASSSLEERTRFRHSTAPARSRVVRVKGRAAISLRVCKIHWRSERLRGQPGRPPRRAQRSLTTAGRESALAQAPSPAASAARYSTRLRSLREA